MEKRDYSPADSVLISVDQALRTLFGRPQVTERRNPRSTCRRPSWRGQRDHIARLMRINHTGEVCAQALIPGPGLTARDPVVRSSMERSAAEENDHLDWCEQRVEELGGRLSLSQSAVVCRLVRHRCRRGHRRRPMEPGVRFGNRTTGRKPSDGHLSEVPDEDQRTRAILEQIENRRDRTWTQGPGSRWRAARTGRSLMKLTAKLMTKSVYRI